MKNGKINLEGLDQNRKTAYGAKFAAVLREDLKKRGVRGVTVRTGRGGYTDSIVLTFCVNSDDFRPGMLYDSPETLVDVRRIPGGYLDRLTDAAYNRISAAYQIVQSYNWDRSDVMRDYFDVGFWLRMECKYRA